MNMNDRFADSLCMTCGVTIEEDENRERHNDFHSLLEQTVLQVFCQDEYYGHYCNQYKGHGGDHANTPLIGETVAWRW